MSKGSAFQSALSYLLVNDGARRALRTDPSRLQQRFGLSEADLSLLQGLDPMQLALSSGIARGKRLNFIQRALPSTCAALTRHHEKLVAVYLRDNFPGASSHGESQALHESRRFVRHLKLLEAELEPWLLELAAYELARLELAASKVALECARRIESTLSDKAGQVSNTDVPEDLSLQPSDLLVTADHVKVVEARCDVIELAYSLSQGEAPEVQQAFTAVTLVRRTKKPQIAAFRAGHGAAAVLKRCAIPTRFDEIKALLADYSNEQFRPWLQTMLRSQLLSLQPSAA